MILADTSVWVEHFRHDEPRLSAALEAERVFMHPFVIGELACGNLRDRTKVLELLGRLPVVPIASDEEARALIERRALMGRGIGLIDVHLLASAAMAASVRLWTHDKRLAAVAAELALAYSP
jgi:predicted nucleic acid-binding protein